MAFKGLETLHCLIKNDLVSKEDCLVAALHLYLVNKGMKCLGIGDEFPENVQEEPSELLPSEWNADQEVYSLRYVSSSGTKYLFKFIKADDSVLINAFNAGEATAAGISVAIDRYVSENFKSFAGNYKNLDELGSNIDKDISTAVHISSENNNSHRDAQTSPTNSSPSPQIDDEGKDNPRNPDDDNPRNPDDDNPRNPDDDNPRNPYDDNPRNPDDAPNTSGYLPVGTRDLDPLGGGGGRGGGMLMDPESMGIPTRPSLPEFGIGGPGGLPRGSVPPGARFDPFGPPMRGRGPQLPRPNPDHLKPPDPDDYI